MKNLAEIIKNNPSCYARIDNDCWGLYRVSPDENPYHEDDPSFHSWEKQNKLAEDGEVKPIGEGYGSGNIYGGDILQALAQIVGVRIESV